MMATELESASSSGVASDNKQVKLSAEEKAAQVERDLAAKSDKKRSALTDTTAHIIKGALVKVLDTTITTSVRFSSPTKGTIAVVYDGIEKPNEAAFKAIQAEVDAIIAANVQIKEEQLNRGSAEAHYTLHPVNKTYIYDQFPVPPEIQTLKIVEIPEWNVNACVGEHFKRTGDVVAIEIGKSQFRKNKKLLEVEFNAGPGCLKPGAKPAAANDDKKEPEVQSASTSKGKKNVKLAPKKLDGPGQFSFGGSVPVAVGPIQTTRNELLEEIFSNLIAVQRQLKQDNVSVTDPEVQRLAIAKLIPRLDGALLRFQNTAYTQGYQAVIK